MKIIKNKSYIINSKTKNEAHPILCEFLLTLKRWLNA